MRDLATIDRDLLGAVSGGLTSNVRARPAEKDPKPLALPGPAQPPPPAAAAPPPAAPPPAPADPMAGMLGQMLQSRLQG